MSIFAAFSMFFMSFLPLWFSIILIDVISIYKSNSVFLVETISIIVILVLIVISIFILRLTLDIKNRNGIQKYYLIKVEEEKSISAEFLLSYVLPLFAFDFTQWDGVVLFLIFFLFLAFLSIKHNYFSVNIYLECIGYSFYKCELLNEEDSIKILQNIISRKNLKIQNNEYISLRSLNNEYSLDLEDG